MKDWEVAFTGEWPALLVACGALAAVVVALLFYRRKREKLSARTLKILSGLRAATIVALAICMLQPVLRFTLTQASQTSVAVLVDVSESMKIQDAAGGSSRLEAAKSLLLDEPSRMLPALKRVQETRIYTFGAVTGEVADPEDLREARPDQKATALGEALKDVVRQVGQSNVSALVLMTDGVSTQGEEPEAAARTLGVPIFPVVLGGRLVEEGRFRDVAIVSVPQNPEFIVNNKATLEIEVSGVGLGALGEEEREMPLLLEAEDGEALAETAVNMPARDGAARVELEFVPDRVGIRRVRARLPELEDETIKENNARTFTIQVTDPRIRVLMVEGTVRSEYRFLRRVLESDPNLEVSSVVKLSGKRFLAQGVQPGVDLSRGLPAQAEDYQEFDVVALGDIGREEFTGVQLELLKDFVDEGGGLLAMGGYHAFGAGGYADSALADVLPVTMGGEGDGHVEEPFDPSMTAEGNVQPVLDGCAPFFRGENRVSLDGANRVTGLKPGADALLVHPIETVGTEPLPVLAAQTYGSGRVLAFTADTTWKWKFQVEATGRDSPYYRLWRQSVRWLAGRDVSEMAPDQLVRAWPARVEYEPDDVVVFNAQVRDRARQPEENAAVDVRVIYPAPIRRKTPDGEERREKEARVNLSPVPLSLGRYQGMWTPPVSGLYHATAQARLDGESLGQDSFEFVVGRAASEFDRVDVAESVLQTLAAQTGGSYHTHASAARIPDELERGRRTVLRHEKINPWDTPWWFFALFLSCIAAEWILRKRQGLD